MKSLSSTITVCSPSIVFFGTELIIPQCNLPSEEIVTSTLKLLMLSRQEFYVRFKGPEESMYTSVYHRSSQSISEEDAWK